MSELVGGPNPGGSEADRVARTDPRGAEPDVAGPDLSGPESEGAERPASSGSTPVPPPEPGRSRRPPQSVRGAVTLLYVAGGLDLLGGVLGTLAAPRQGGLIVFGVVSLVFGAAYLVLATRIRAANRTARTVAVGLAGLSLLGGLLQLAGSLRAVVGVLLNAGILYLLLVPHPARRFFGDSS